MKGTTEDGMLSWSCFTYPGSGGCNEDAVGGGPWYCYVIDGATGLTGEPACMDSWRTDAAWFAGETARWLETHWDQPAGLGEILSQGMDHLRSRWKGRPEAMPSGGIAVLRCRAGWIELFLLGDCLCSLRRRDGTFLTLQEEALSRLDGQALRELTCHAQRLGRPPAACLPLIQETLLRHRALRNRPGGYWVLDPGGKGIPHARQMVLPQEACHSVFLCTDGFAQWMDFVGASPEALHQGAACRGLDSLAEELFAWQEADPDFFRLPRFKLRDDASATYGVFGL